MAEQMLLKDLIQFFGDGEALLQAVDPSIGETPGFLCTLCRLRSGTTCPSDQFRIVGLCPDYDMDTSDIPALQARYQQLQKK